MPGSLGQVTLCPLGSKKHLEKVLCLLCWFVLLLWNNFNVIVLMEMFLKIETCFENDMKEGKRKEKLRGPKVSHNGHLFLKLSEDIHVYFIAVDSCMSTLTSVAVYLFLL